MAPEASKPRRPFLFVNSTGPTHISQRDKSTRTSIHRHVMFDIGKARRKQPRNPQFDTVVRLKDGPNQTEATSQLHQKRMVNSSGSGHALESLESAAPHQMLPSTSYYDTILSLVPPFWTQHPVLTLESQWDDDMFSAYGMMLLLQASSNLVGKDTASEVFWFPFAFTSSPFLRHFQPVFHDPIVLGGVSRTLSAKFTVMALERLSLTMSCIDNFLSICYSTRQTTNNVIRGVMAVICYNFLSADYDQALVHVRGLQLIIETQGGIQNLQGYNDLRLMVFWIDVTASLVFGISPYFHPPLDLIPPLWLAGYPHDIPLPKNVIADLESTSDVLGHQILSCTTDLAGIATFINDELAIKGDGLWQDTIPIELRTNCLLHRLLRIYTKSRSLPADRNLEGMLLGAIVWIIGVKRLCGSLPGALTIDYFSLLIDLLVVKIKDKDSSGNSHRAHMRNWQLLICGINTSSPTQRCQCAGLIADIMRNSGWQWAQFVASTEHMPCIIAFETSRNQLYHDVISKL